MKRINVFFLFLCITLLIVASENKEKQNLKLVFIGNSITEGALLEDPIRGAPPVKTEAYLRKHLKNCKIETKNCGVSGSTTLDFLPATGTLFKNVQTVADTLKKDDAAQLIFSIMLGTNDSAIKGPHGAPVAPTQYRTNLKAIIDKLLMLYPDSKIILHYPIWYSPNTYNSAMYLVEGQKRLLSYFPEIDSLVQEYTDAGSKVYKGDEDAYGYFKEHYLTDLFAEDGNAGIFYLHPNEKGGNKLAAFWGKAIIRAINSK